MRLRRSSSARRYSRTPIDALLFGAVPLFVLATFSVLAYREGVLGFDFEHFLLPAARTVADGGSPYPSYGYPPLVAFALVPFTVLPGPNIFFVVLLAACLPASLWFLGVRDWRCYGVVFLWAPVLAALQTSNVTILLLLGSAICWHSRDRWRPAAVAGGLAIAAKLLCAPLVIWLVATRRYAATVGVAVVAGGVSLVLWAALGFAYVAEYPARVGAIDRIESPESYTLKALFGDLGIDPTPAKVGWALVGLSIVVAAAVLGWRGDDRRSFSLAVAAMIFAIPVVWMHSFALLLAPVAVMRPRLSAAWLVPILLVIGSGTGNGNPWQTAGVLGIAVLTLGLALVPLPARRWRRSSAGESAARA